MSTLFCPSCGSKNPSLNGNKPNFCFSCGHDFKSLAVFGATPAKKQQPLAKRVTARYQEEEPEVDDENQGYEVPEEAGISVRDIKVEIDRRSEIKVGDIINTASQGLGEGRHDLNIKIADRDGKAAFASYQAEAGKGPLKVVEVG